MTTIEELVVRAKPEGIEETSEGFDQMQEDLEEVEEGMDDTADSMEDASSKWQGAMSAIVAGLAVGTAGLLSRIPVLGEALGGLLSIIDALAYQMDQILRPVLQPVTGFFYDMSEGIYELEGAAGAIVGVLSTVAATLTGIAGVAKLVGSSLSGVISFIAGLGPVIGGITAGMATLAAAVGAIIGLIGVLILDITGVLDWFRQLGRDARPILNHIIRGLSRISNALSDIVNMAIDLVFNFVNDPIGTVKDILSALKEVANNVWDTVVDVVLTITDPVTGPAGEFERGVASFVDPRQEWNFTNPLSGGGNNPGPIAPRRQTRTTPISLDGRDLTENTGRYRVDNTTRRGRGP